MGRERRRCDYPRKEEGKGLVCRITGFNSNNRGKLAEQCPVDEKNECARDFVEEKGFWRPDRIMVTDQGRDG